MTWLAWRLQRTEMLVAVGILALIAALLIPTGISMANSYHANDLGSCLGHTDGQSCLQRIGDFQARFQSLNFIANWFTLVPGLIGVLLAAPFILELEQRTYQLVWTQSITRRRWLVVKLALPVIAAVIATAVLIALVTWWRAPLTNLNGGLDTGTFDTTGTVAIGYALLALGLAVVLGAFWRRPAAALTVAFVGYFVMRAVDDLWLRSHLLSPLKATWHGATLPAYLAHANIISQSVTVDGRVVESSSGSGSVLGASAQLGLPDNGANAITHVVYQPATAFWTLQFRETLLFAAIGLLLMGFGAWWTYRRTE
jgi:hypothetical protein